MSALTSPVCYATLFAVQRRPNIRDMKRKNNNVTKGTIRKKGKKKRKRRIKKIKTTTKKKSNINLNGKVKQIKGFKVN
jgi:hypothetical protein